MILFTNINLNLQKMKNSLFERGLFYIFIFLYF